MGIAVQKYDEAVHAGRLCGREKRQARRIVEHTKGVLKFWKGDGS